jgi:hypothetical protein
MSDFTTPLDLVATGERDSQGRPLYRVTRDLVYEIGFKGSNITVIVPEGRITNLATIPNTPLIKWLYSDLTRPGSKYVAAPVLHDFMCNEKFPGFPMEKSGFNRFEADAMFRSALIALKYKRWKRIAVYCAVRAWAILNGLQ